MVISEFEMLEHLEHDLRNIVSRNAYASNLLHGRSKTKIKAFFSTRTTGIRPEKARVISRLLNAPLPQKKLGFTLEQKLSAYADQVRGHLERIKNSSSEVGQLMKEVGGLSRALRTATEQNDGKAVETAENNIAGRHPEIMQKLRDHATYLNVSAKFIQERAKELRRMHGILRTPQEARDEKELALKTEAERTNP